MAINGEESTHGNFGQTAVDAVVDAFEDDDVSMTSSFFFQILN